MIRDAYNHLNLFCFETADKQQIIMLFIAYDFGKFVLYNS